MPGDYEVTWEDETVWTFGWVPDAGCFSVDRWIPEEDDFPIDDIIGTPAPHICFVESLDVLEEAMGRPLPADIRAELQADADAYPIRGATRLVERVGRLRDHAQDTRRQVARDVRAARPSRSVQPPLVCRGRPLHSRPAVATRCESADRSPTSEADSPDPDSPRFRDAMERPYGTLRRSREGPGAGVEG